MPHFAICYHGMTRSTRYVYNSHYEKIFDVLTNNGATFDVFLHTWKTDKNIVWYEDIGIPNDYTEHEFLRPKYYQLDNQDDFLNSINFSDYYYEGSSREWAPDLVRNHICALESQKRCFNMCLASGIKYDYVIFARPDSIFHHELPYKEIVEENGRLQDNTILISPRDSWEGYNDKFAIVRFEHAHHYGTRIDEIIDYRKNIDYIVSEKYVKYIIDKYYKVRFIDFSIDIERPK